MTSKEFDLLISLLIELLENGKVDRAIELLKKARGDGEKE